HPDEIPEPLLCGIARRGPIGRLKCRRAERHQFSVPRHDDVIGRQANWRVGVAAAVDPLKNGFMYLGHWNADADGFVVAKVGYLARAVTVICAEPRAGVIKTPVLV